MQYLACSMYKHYFFYNNLFNVGVTIVTELNNQGVATATGANLGTLSWAILLI